MTMTMTRQTDRLLQEGESSLTLAGKTTPYRSSDNLASSSIFICTFPDSCFIFSNTGKARKARVFLSSVLANTVNKPTHSLVPLSASVLQQRLQTVVSLGSGNTHGDSLPGLPTESCQRQHCP